jgi:hypothetical protein
MVQLKNILCVLRHTKVLFPSKTIAFLGYSIERVFTG